MLCVLIMENKKENVSKKVSTIIISDTFISFIKNTWIGDSGASCYIMNDDTSLFNIIHINELIQESSGSMPATKKASFKPMYSKLMRLNVSILSLWPVKFCPKAGANLSSLMCNLLQKKKDVKQPPKQHHG